MATPSSEKSELEGSLSQADDKKLENVDIEPPAQADSEADTTAPSEADLPGKATEGEQELKPSSAIDANGTSEETPSVTVTSNEDTAPVPENEKEPRPSASTQSLPTSRRSRRLPSFALSTSSIGSNGQSTVPSAVFIKKALETISKHKATSKNAALESACAKALSKLFLRCLSILSC